MTRNEWRKLPLAEQMKLLRVLDVLNVEQAAAYLQCTERTIYRMIERCDVNNVSKTRGMVLVRKEDLLAS